MAVARRVTYDVHFLDHEGNVFSSDVIEALNDHAAIDAAKRIFRVGVGSGFEIRQGSRFVGRVNATARSAKRPDEAARPRRASDYETFATECVRLASTSNILEVREQLMDLRDTYLAIAAQIEEGRRKDAGPQRGYSLYLRDAGGQIVARDHIEVDNDREAHAIAVVLLDACADVCSQFELWKGETMMSMGARPRQVPAPSECTARVQQIVIEREIALRDSYHVIAGSKRLLAKVAEWTTACEG